MATTPARIHPEQRQVGALFNKSCEYRVPRFQRHYAWERDEVVDFLDDIERCYKARLAGDPVAHFFGGIVAINEASAPPLMKLLVIDGQQRLSTFSLLASAIILELRTLKEALKDGHEIENAVKLFYDQCFNGYIQHIQVVGNTTAPIERLTVSRADASFFRALLRGEEPPKPSRTSHELLLDANKQIRKRVSQIVGDGDAGEQFQRIQTLNAVLDSDLSVIFMTASDERLAHQLFQTLNDRGRGLSEGELLRSFTLEKIDPLNDENALAEAESAWDEILGLDPRLIKNGLAWIYASHKGARPRPSALYDDFKEAFFEDKAANDVRAAVQALREDFKIVDVLQKGEWPFVPIKCTAMERQRLLLLIKSLGHDNCMPLLIAAAAKLEEKSFLEIVETVERFVFRYKIIVGERIDPAQRVYQQQAKAIRESEGGHKITGLRDALTALVNDKADNTRFTTALGELPYEKKSARRRILAYFLITLEACRKWAENGANGRATLSNDPYTLHPDEVTLEHIHPRSKSAELGEDARYADLLGNLTLLSATDNNAAGDKEADKKLPILEKSPFWMNREIAKSKPWTTEVIKNRHKVFLDLAAKLFTP